MKTSGTIEEKPISGFNFAITFQIYGFVAFVRVHTLNVRATVILPPAHLYNEIEKCLFFVSFPAQSFSQNELRIDAF